MNSKELQRRCNEYKPDIELIGDSSVDYGHNLADLLLQAKEERMIDLETDFEFIKKADNWNLNPEKIFENTEDKSKLLKEIKGYKKLKANNSEGRGAINYSTKAKIGKVFQNVYYSSLKNMKSLN